MQFGSFCGHVEVAVCRLLGIRFDVEHIAKFNIETNFMNDYGLLHTLYL